LKNRYFSNVIGKLWAGRGYHVIFQGTRGRYKSEGNYYPLVSERQDGLDTLRWLKKQPWYDGHLGMWGGSYFGYTQWVLADPIDPGPSAFLIQLASTNFYEMLYPGGAFSLESALIWALWSTENKEHDFPPEILRRGYDSFPLIQIDDRARKDIPFFNDWVNHHEEDSYWKKVNVRENIKQLNAPVLLMAGWYDPFLPSQLADFSAIQKNAKAGIGDSSKIIIGPWGHARTVIFPDGSKSMHYRLESLAPSIPWFDQSLSKGKDTGFMALPIKIYVMGKNIWREEKEWPLARTKYTPYYLRSSGKANTLRGDGKLDSENLDQKEIFDEYFYDPRNPAPSAGGTMIGPNAGIAKQNNIEARQDVLVYTGAPIDYDLEVTGPIKLVLYVSTTAVNTDFTAKLVDVHPDGSAYNVCDGILRRSYIGSSMPTEIQIDLWPTSMVFLKGHRVRLEVSSSNYPRFDRNPNTGRNIALETEPVVAKQKIYQGKLYPSRLILPVIEDSHSVISGGLRYRK
jgi:putative CocE/NonD family hydrolase